MVKLWCSPLVVPVLVIRLLTKCVLATVSTCLTMVLLRRLCRLVTLHLAMMRLCRRCGTAMRLQWNRTDDAMVLVDLWSVWITTTECVLGSVRVTVMKPHRLLMLSIICLLLSVLEIVELRRAVTTVAPKNWVRRCRVMLSSLCLLQSLPTLDMWATLKFLNLLFLRACS